MLKFGQKPTGTTTTTTQTLDSTPAPTEGGFDPQKDILSDGALPANMQARVIVRNIEVNPRPKVPGTFGLTIDVELLSPTETTDAAGTRVRVAGRKAKFWLDVNFEAPTLGPSWARANTGLAILGFPVAGRRASAAAYVNEVVKWVKENLPNTQFDVLIDGTEELFEKEPQTAEEIAAKVEPKNKLDENGQPISVGHRLKMLQWNKIQSRAVIG